MNERSRRRYPYNHTFDTSMSAGLCGSKSMRSACVVERSCSDRPSTRECRTTRVCREYWPSRRHLGLLGGSPRSRTVRPRILSGSTPRHWRQGTSCCLARRRSPSTKDWCTDNRATRASKAAPVPGHTSSSRATPTPSCRGDKQSRGVATVLLTASIGMHVSTEECTSTWNAR